MSTREENVLLRRLVGSLSKVVERIRNAAQDVGMIGYVRDGEGLGKSDVTDAVRKIGRFMDVLGNLDVSDITMPVLDEKTELDEFVDKTLGKDYAGLTGVAHKAQHPQPHPGDDKKLLEMDVRFAKVLTVTWAGAGGGKVSGNFIVSITAHRCDSAGNNVESTTLDLKATDPASAAEKGGLVVKVGFADIEEGDIVGYLPMFSDTTDWDGTILVHFGANGAILSSSISPTSQTVKIVSYAAGVYVVQPVVRADGAWANDGSQLTGIHNYGEVQTEEAGYLAGPGGEDIYVPLFTAGDESFMLVHPSRMV